MNRIRGECDVCGATRELTILDVGPSAYAYCSRCLLEQFKICRICGCLEFKEDFPFNGEVCKDCWNTISFKEGE